MKNYLKKKLNKKGFTLIELIVVIAILAILALILVPSISNYVAEANKSKDEANVRSVYSQLTAEVAMGVEANKFGFTVEDKVAKSATITKAAGDGVPSGMSITYTIANGVVSEFNATINGVKYTANDAGELTGVPVTE